MNRFAIKFNALIQETITAIMHRGDVDKSVQYIASETLGEVIEKLLILHIRIWHLEDEAGLAAESGDMECLTALHVKIDECDKIVRRRLMAALTRLLVEAVTRNRMELLGTGDLKQYKGFDS